MKVDGRKMNYQYEQICVSQIIGSTVLDGALTVIQVKRFMLVMAYRCRVFGFDDCCEIKLLRPRLRISICQKARKHRSIAPTYKYAGPKIPISNQPFMLVSRPVCLKTRKSFLQ